jgi:hypothetical protein
MRAYALTSRPKEISPKARAAARPAPVNAAIPASGTCLRAHGYGRGYVAVEITGKIETGRAAGGTWFAPRSGGPS